MSTLTLEEEQLARTLKAQGKSTAEIMGAIGKQRLAAKNTQWQSAGVAPTAAQPTQQSGILGRVLKDIPSDYAELGANMEGSLRGSFDAVANSLKSESGSMAQRATGALYNAAAAPVKAAGEVVVGTAKLATTDEFEKQLGGNIANTAQSAVNSKVGQFVQRAGQNMSPGTLFNLKNIVAPGAELFGEAATGGLGLTAARGIKETVKSAFERGVQDVATGVPSQPVIPPGVMPPETVTAVRDTYNRAIKPNLSSLKNPGQVERYNSSVTNAVNSIVANKDNLTLLDDATGEMVTGKLPESLKEFVDAIEQTKGQIFRQYDEIATKAGEFGAKVDTLRIATELDSIISSKSLKLSNPEAIAYAESVKNRLLKTRDLTSVDAQDVIKNYNNSLQAFYKNPTPEGLSRNAVDALVANKLRVNLDEAIEGLTGDQYQALKNEYASLKTVERDVLRAYLRDARKNTKGLIDFTDVLTGGQVVSGILSFNPAAVAQGLAGKAIAEGIKWINDPNRAVKKIFESAARYAKPKAGPGVSTRKQLPAANPDAPRSEVGSGAPIQAGGQTPAGRVEPGLTERTQPGAIKQPGGTPATSPVKELQNAEAEAIESIRGAIDMSEAMTVNTADGGITRVSSFPNWLPDDKELRSKELMEKVLKHIEDGTIPAETSSNQFRLWEVMKQQFERVKFDKLNAQKGTGITADDMPFALLLTTGVGLAAYYTMSEDGSLIPLAAIGMVNPATRKIVADNLLKHIDEMESAALRTQSKAAKNGFQKAIDTAKLEYRRLMDDLKDPRKRNGGFIKNPFIRGETPPTKVATPSLLKEATKYKSAEEFVKKQPTLYHRTDVEFDDFDVSLDPDNFGAWFFTDKKLADSYADEFPIEMVRYSDKPLKLIKDEDIGDKFMGDADRFLSLDESLRKAGYDGIDHGNGTVQIINPNALTTKSQLTDIWNKANTK
jgi:hypothetical protein